MANDTTVRIPGEWKSAVTQFRDAVTVEQGEVLLQAIADLAESGNLREVQNAVTALANGVTTISDSVTAGVTETVTASATAPTIQGRAVPTALAGMVEELVELHRHHPQLARKILAEALSAPVEPESKPVEGVSFRLENEYLTADTFDWLGNQKISIPIGKLLTWPEKTVADLERQIASRPSNWGKNVQAHTKLIRV